VAARIASIIGRGLPFALDCADKITPLLGDLQGNRQNAVREPRQDLGVEPVFENDSPLALRQGRDSLSDFTDGKHAHKHAVFGLVKKCLYLRFGRRFG
jgi:hypothetical protein